MSASKVGTVDVALAGQWFEDKEFLRVSMRAIATNPETPDRIRQIAIHALRGIGEDEE